MSRVICENINNKLEFKKYCMLFDNLNNIDIKEYPYSTIIYFQNPNKSINFIKYLKLLKNNENFKDLKYSLILNKNNNQVLINKDNNFKKTQINYKCINSNNSNENSNSPDIKLEKLNYFYKSIKKSTREKNDHIENSRENVFGVKLNKNKTKSKFKDIKNINRTTSNKKNISNNNLPYLDINLKKSNPLAYNVQKFRLDCEKIKKYLKKSTPLNISAPYMDQFTFQKIFYRNNEDNNINNYNNSNIRDSFKYFPSKKDNYIFDSIFKTPSSKVFKYREENKNKWIEHKNFDLYKNGKDYILKQE